MTQTLWLQWLSSFSEKAVFVQGWFANSDVDQQWTTFSSSGLEWPNLGSGELVPGTGCFSLPLLLHPTWQQCTHPAAAQFSMGKALHHESPNIVGRVKWLWSSDMPHGLLPQFQMMINDLVFVYHFSATHIKMVFKLGKMLEPDIESALHFPVL